MARRSSLRGMGSEAATDSTYFVQGVLAIIRGTMRLSGLLLLAGAPAIALAPPGDDRCWDRKSACTTCGGLSSTICNDGYQEVSSGGRKWGSGATEDKWCYEYGPGGTSVTPCTVDPPPGFARSSCPGAGGNCCDINSTATPVRTFAGTQTRPNGFPCTTGGGPN